MNPSPLELLDKTAGMRVLVPICSWWDGRRGHCNHTLLPLLCAPQHCLPSVPCTSGAWCSAWLAPSQNPHQRPRLYHLPHWICCSLVAMAAQRSLLASLNVEPEMPWLSGQQHNFPKPFGREGVVEAERGAITAESLFLKKFSQTVTPVASAPVTPQPGPHHPPPSTA